MNEIIEKFKALCAKIKYHAELYYRENRSEISDSEYDQLVIEQRNMLVTFPDLAQYEQTIDKQAAPIQVSSLDKIVLDPPMLSLDNVFSPEEYKAWLTKLPKEAQDDISYEWKWDGLALRLIYEDGVLKTISTRSTGTLGEDVTASLPYFVNIPTELPADDMKGKTIIIDGEGIMNHATFLEVNEIVPEPYATPRHAAAGIVRNRSMSERLNDSLAFIAHTFPRAIGSTYEDTMYALSKLGFSTSADYSVHEITEQRPTHLPFPVDGIVAKVKNVETRTSLGVTAHHPKWAIAYKFPMLVEETTLEDVVWETGRTGTITPVAEFKAVNIAGVSVRRAQLFNYRTFQRSAEGLHVGSKIEVGMAGDIIPHFIGVTQVGKGRKCHPPKECPACGEPIRIDGEDAEQVFITCTNHDRCPAQCIGRLYHFGSEHAMDIKGLGPATIKSWESQGFLNQFVDLYFLRQRTQGTFLSKNQLKLLDEIDRSRKTTITRLITGLGIPGVGVGTAKLIATLVNGKEDLIATLDDQTKLMGLPNVSWSVALSCSAYVKANSGALERLLEQLEFTGTEPAVDLLPIVVTGKFPFPRKAMESLLGEAGYEVSNRVTKETKLVVLGERYTKHKETTANDLGITTLTINVHPELTVNEVVRDILARV